MADFLTYTSIVLAYVPIMMKELAASGEARGTGAMIVTLIVAIPLSYALPFMQGIQNVLGILIIAFGLYQAWKMNAKETLQVSGPYSLAARAAAPAAAVQS
jgi:hypothetical protein